MEFSIGDRVSILDEVGVGTILSIQNQSVTVLMDDGFDYTYPQSQIVPVQKHEVDDILKEQQFQSKIIEDQQPQRTRPTSNTNKEKVTPTTFRPQEWSIDLHINVLVDRYEHLSNAEILAIQMTRCRSFINRVMDKGVKKFVLIHGKGEGVLKSAIHHYLIQRGDVSFDDADRFVYGSGATEVRFVD